MIELIGYIAAILGAIGWLPQVMKAYKTRETADLSVSSLLMIMGCTSLWLIYGIAHVSIPIMLGNFLALTFVTLILIAKFRFG